MALMQSIAGYIQHFSLNIDLPFDEHEDVNEAGDNTYCLAHIVPALNYSQEKLVAVESFALISGYGDQCILCDAAVAGYIRPGHGPRYPIALHLVATFTNITELKILLDSEDLATFIAFICSFP
ncbi:hypothetical protein PM082_012623 [Marasmius tenuissimus]|nr:hypothetical protein PM082_012623 [Marasmius tenuissimus]